MLGATLNKRYALEQLLAKGESGSLYLATDTATGEMLAARVFSSGVRLGDENGLRFLRVMTLLAGVRHPNLLLPVETGSAAGLGPDELTYQITPYYPAPSLEQAMRELPFSLKEGVALLRQAALGLDALHQAGVVHGNLKPSNILVSREGDHLSAVVLDPARGLLAAPLAGAGQLAHAVWMAPEETGWGPRGCDDRSDLYRLGLLGYRVMTGRLPFAGNTPHQMAQHHLATMPPSPREINGVIPPRLAAILLKLLAKNPVDRYQTARGLLADLDLWDQPPELPLATRDTPPRFPLAGPVTGREGAGEALLAALERARSGQGGGLVVLSGESGQGKRSLFQSLEPSLVGGGGLVLEGRIPQGDWCAPYQLPLSLIEDLLGRLDGMAPHQLRDLLYRLHETVGDNAAVLKGYLPELAVLLPREEAAPPLPPDRETRRAASLFTSFLLALAEPHHPLVLWLGEIHWADPDSVFWLSHLLLRLPSAPVVAVAGFNPARLAPDQPLNLWLKGSGRHPAITWVDCPPLTQDQVERLIKARLGLAGGSALSVSNPAFAKPLAEWVRRVWGGSPLVLDQVLRILLTTGTLALTSAGEGAPPEWRMDWEGMESLGLEETQGGVIRQRLALLPKPLPQVLEVLAVSHAPLPFEALVFCLAPMPPPLVLEHIEALAAQGLVVRGFGGAGMDGLEIPSRRVAEEIHSASQPRKKEALHLLLAGFLEERGPGADNRGSRLQWFHWLARHFQRAGDAKRFARHGLRAAQEAHRRNAPRGAVTWYRTVLPQLADSSALPSALAALGELLGWLGQTLQAQETLEQAQKLAADYPDSQPFLMELTRVQAAAAHGAGRPEEAVAWLERGLKLAGESLPTGPMASVLARLAATAGIGRQGLPGTPLPSSTEGGQVTLTEQEAAVAALLESAARILYTLHPHRAVLADEKILAINTGKVLSPQGLRALIRLGESAGQPDGPPFQAVWDILKQRPFPFEEALYHLAQGRCHLNRFHPARAQAGLQTARAGFRALGDGQGEAETLVLLLETARLEGRMAPLTATARELVQWAEAQDHPELRAWGQTYLLYGEGMGGHKPVGAAVEGLRSLAEAFREMGDKPGGRFALALGVELLLLDGDTQAAWEILDSALGETGSAPEDFTVPWLKGARAETHFLTAMAEPDRFEAHLRKGRQSLKEAMAAEKPHPRLVLETIRLEVVLRMLQGEPHTARKALEEGEALLSDQGARLALARLYFSYAELLKGASGEDWPGWGAKALSLAAALDAGLLAAAIRQLLELEPESPQEAPLQDPPPLAQNGWGGMVHPAMAALLERLETEGPKALSGLPRGVLRVLMDGADAERGALFLPDENGVLVLTEAIPPLLPGVDWVNHWLVESAWQERQGRILDNFQPASERADALPPQSVCALVATSAKGPVGVIVLSSGMGGTVFTPDLLEPLEHLARQGGVVFAVKAALDRQREAYGRLNTEFNEWRQWVEWSLHAGAKELDQPEGLEAVLAALLKDVAEPRGFTHLVLYWRETSGGGLVPEAWISASGQPRQVEDLPRLPLDNFVSRAGEVFRNLLPARMAAPDGALPTHEEKSLMTALGGQDGLWLPIQADGTGVGLLAAVSTTRMAGLTEAAAEAAGEELRLPLRLLGPVLGRARTARLLGRETLSLRRHSTTLEGSGQQFQRFLPPSMAAHLQNETSSKTNKPGLAGPLLPGPLLPEGWEESGVVLLCGRMKGLVRLQRQVKAEGLGETRAYYRQVERALALHHGVLEKIEREEWLARIPGGTENSLWGALTLIQTLAGNQENRTGGQPPPITGLGIHRGRLLGDVVQAGDKLEALLGGEGPHTASRLAARALELNCPVLVSGQVAADLEAGGLGAGEFQLRPMGVLEAQEGGERIEIHELLAWLDEELLRNMAEQAPVWQAAMGHLQFNRPEEARQALQTYLEVLPKDGPARYFLKQLGKTPGNPGPP